MNAGVYAIRNTVNGKAYIGYTTDFAMRKSTHWHNLREGKGLPNKHLQAAWNRYGEKAFSFEIVEVVKDLTNIESVEQGHIEKCGSNQREKGYNKRIECRSNLGVTWSDETKARMSESHRGEKGYWWKREFSKEHKKNISDAKLGIVTWNKGKPHLVGEKNPRAILDSTQVLEIKQLMEKGIRNCKIAEMFGVSKHVVSGIKTGKTWASVG